MDMQVTSEGNSKGHLLYLKGGFCKSIGGFCLHFSNTQNQRLCNILRYLGFIMLLFSFPSLPLIYELHHFMALHFLSLSQWVLSNFQVNLECLCDLIVAPLYQLLTVIVFQTASGVRIYHYKPCPNIANKLWDTS